ncbi:MAG: AraC family transcriptional regulator [Acidobacteriota bacterium]|nr:AraC family transcriptional regulator [Acidobacteriota bacterium]
MSNNQSTEFRFRYREVSPPADISHLAFCFFEFSIDRRGTEPIPYEVVPDGFISILFRRAAGSEERALLLARGLSLESFATTVMPGDVHWGFRISPASNRRILRCDPKSVPTRPLHGPHLLGHVTSALSPKLKSAKSYEHACDMFTWFLRNLEVPPGSIDGTISAAVEAIMKSRGDIRITDLALDVGVNKRLLERRFRREVGLTAKQYARVFRFRSTAISLIEEDNLNWANRAAEMGFADQSHLIKEFVTLTGRTPKRFSANAENTDYGKLLS